MTDSAAVAGTSEACFEFKGAMLTLTVLELRYFDIEAFETTLREKIRQAPGFFRDLPLVIGLDRFEGNPADLDFFQLIGSCRTHSIQVLGVKGGGEDMRRLARNASLAWLPSESARRGASEASQQQSGADDQTGSGEPASEPTEGRSGRLVTLPVRSGQQVYAPEGDLIIMAPVSAGAEVLAAGHVHIYGPLRGRALAGVHGDTSASIFCQSLEAELVSIAGHYKISEDLQNNCWREPAQVTLRDEVLTVGPLGRG